MDLARVIILTGDVKRLVDFYAACFGFSVIGEFDAEWTEMNAGRCNIAFHKIGGQYEIGSFEDSGVKLVFGTNDVAIEKERLEGLGVMMTETFEFGDIQMADGYDPDGHRFQISSRGQ